MNNCVNEGVFQPCWWGHTCRATLDKKSWEACALRCKCSNCLEINIKSRLTGSQYWVFRDTQAKDGYPRALSDWGMRTRGGAQVEKVDAAFIWAHNGKTYLFSGGDFWRFDESSQSQQDIRHPEAGYPRDTTLWRGVPANVDDIISWGEGRAWPSTIGTEPWGLSIVIYIGG